MCEHEWDGGTVRTLHGSKGPLQVWRCKSCEHVLVGNGEEQATYEAIRVWRSGEEQGE